MTGAGSTQPDRRRSGALAEMDALRAGADPPAVDPTMAALGVTDA
jgi:hypothetical protein